MKLTSLCTIPVFMLIVVISSNARATDLDKEKRLAYYSRRDGECFLKENYLSWIRCYKLNLIPYKFFENIAKTSYLKKDEYLNKI
jgi:hypothetical protein